jgi:pimeloyl-ACP methyl ester carboxylesterase
MALVHHVTHGTGMPPLVLVHGFGCSNSDWRKQVAHFAGGHRVIAVDLPGHGASPAEPAECGLEAYGAAVATLMRSLRLPPCVIVGHSMGCRVVTEAAIQAPEHIAGVILLDGSQFSAGMGPVFAERFARGEYPAIVGGMFEQMFTARTDRKEAEEIMTRARRLPAAVGQRMLADMVRYDSLRFEATLKVLDKPLMALQSTFTNERRERSTMKPGQTTPYLDMVRRAMPAARIEIIPDVGHFPQLDAPEEANRAIASFLATIR